MLKRILPLLIALLFCGGVYAACPAPFTCGTEQANYNGSASPTNTVTVTCSATCDLPIAEQHNIFGSPTFTIVIDGALTPSQVGSDTANSAEDMSLWVYLGASAGSHSILTTYSNSPSSGLWVIPVMGGAHVLDGAGGTTNSNNFAGPGTNVVNGEGLTTAVPGDLIVSIGNWVSCAGGSCPLTPGTSPNAFTGLSNCAAQVGSSLCQVLVQAVAGSIQPTMTLGSNGGDIITATLALQAAGGGGGGGGSGQSTGLLLGVGQ